jgi:predicted HAD superfamily Cof-like phosphohydrolase
MTNIFKDQEHFMKACDQTVGEKNPNQYELYLDLIEEELEELNVAVLNDDRVEQLDALIDLLVVTVGAIHSMPFNGELAWNEVMRSNLSKIDPVSGKVIKRDDGKVLKPDNWQPPQLKQFIGDEHE